MKTRNFNIDCDYDSNDRIAKLVNNPFGGVAIYILKLDASGYVARIRFAGVRQGVKKEDFTDREWREYLRPMMADHEDYFIRDRWIWNTSKDKFEYND